jgi:DNA-binding NarL/FixJ family response regulator
LLRSVLSICIRHLDGYDLVLASGCEGDAEQAAAAMAPPAIAIILYQDTGTTRSLGGYLAGLRERWPTTLLFTITDRLDTAWVQAAVQAGCTGFACRMTTGFEKLRTDLHQLYTTGACYPPEAVRALAQPPPPESELDRILRVLNPTQLKMLDAVCAPDEPTWELVAQRVGRSMGCIEWNTPRMFAALEVKGKPGLVALGQRNGFGQGRYS